jgi:hypothetical protein
MPRYRVQADRVGDYTKGKDFDSEAFFGEGKGLADDTLQNLLDTGAIVETPPASEGSRAPQGQAAQPDTTLWTGPKRSAEAQPSAGQPAAPPTNLIASNPAATTPAPSAATGTPADKTS